MMKKNVLLALTAVVLMAACDDGGPFDRPTSLEELSETLHADSAAIATALQAGDCETVRTVLNRTPRYLPIDRATLLMEGRCLPQDPAQAAQILRKMVEPGADDYNAMARLGALYETGEGGDQDLARAQTLYRRAIGWMGLDWVEALRDQELEQQELSGHVESYVDSVDPSINALLNLFPSAAEAAPLWDLSIEEAIYGFVEPASGPWTLPPMLQAEINAMRPLIEGGGAGALTMAEQFKEGIEGYPIDDVIAFQWIRQAALYDEYISARRAYAAWLADPDFCHDDPLCQRFPFQYNQNLIELARLGDVPAIDALSTCIQTAPEYDEKPLGVYFWIHQRVRYGLPVDEATLQMVDEAVSDEKEPIRQVLERLIIPAKDMKEMLRAWDVSDGPVPYTVLSDEMCALGAAP